MLNNHPVTISCVTFETAMVVEPIFELDSRDIYLFHYIRDPEEKNGKIYLQFYEEVCRQIIDRLPGASITEIDNFPIYELDTMIREISNCISEIRRYNPDGRVLINVSSGSKQFCIAGVIVSNRCENVDILTASTKEYQVDNDKVIQTYFEDGRPVGQTKHCNPVKIFEKLDILYSEENVVRALRAFIEFYDKKRYSISKDVVKELESKGLMPEGVKPSVSTYERYYRNKWHEMGWIEKDPKVSRRYKPTSRGRRMAATFFTK